MIINTLIPSRQAVLAMPVSGYVGAAWVGARPEFKGEVSVLRTDLRGVVSTTTDVPAAFPGIPAWSPPI